MYLEDSGIRLYGYTFWGSPWTVEHNPGAFTRKSEAELARRFAEIPDSCDVLITHSPPYGALDMAGYTRHVGSESLLAAVQRVRPQLHLFGHLHDCYGHLFADGTHFINSAACNNRYQLVHQPFVVDLPVLES